MDDENDKVWPMSWESCRETEFMNFELVLAE